MVLVFTCPSCGRVPARSTRARATWDGPVRICAACREPVTSEPGDTFHVRVVFQDAGADGLVTGTFTLDEVSAEAAVAIVCRVLAAQGSTIIGEPIVISGSPEDAEVALEEA